MVIVLMGTAGAGKTTIGRALAAVLDWRFVEGDAYHTPANIERMRLGEALTDDDRASWLAILHQVIARAIDRRDPTIVACSALKERYRNQLAGGLKLVRFVHLTADPEVLRDRLMSREHHFAGPALLTSQLATLEKPADALTLDTSKDPAITIGRIRDELGI
jgi:gluconokinase